MNIFTKIDNIPSWKRGLVALGFGLVGLGYLAIIPTEKSNYDPLVIKTQNYTLTDADRDGDVDSIAVPNKPRRFVTPNMVGWFKDHGETFIDFMYQPPAITPEMQREADLVLHGQKDDSRLRELLK